MAQQTRQGVRRSDDYVVALTRLFIEAFNARDYGAGRALVSGDWSSAGRTAPRCADIRQRVSC